MQKPQNFETPENWDAASQGYAEHVAPLVMEAYADALVDLLDVNENTEALEVAAGSGALTATLAPRVKSLLATDFSPKMVAMLEQRMRAAGMTNVTCRVMDGQELDLDDDSFDRAACSFALMLFPDCSKGFSELHRVLRPGGRAVVSGWSGPDEFEGLGLFLSAVRTALPDMPAPTEPPPVFRLADPVKFKAEMEGAGFQRVEVQHVTRELEVASFEDLWTVFTVGAPPMRALFDRVGQEGESRTRDALAGIVEKRFGSGPIVTSNQATVGHGSVAS